MKTKLKNRGLSSLDVTDEMRKDAVRIRFIYRRRYSGDLNLSIQATFALLTIGIYFLYFAFKLMQEKTKRAARKLMYASILYISFLQIIYVNEKLI